MKKLLISAALLGLLAFAGQAQAQFINAQTGTTYTFANTDCGKLVTFNNSGAIAATLPEASGPSGTGSGSGLFMPPCAIEVLDLGSGTVTVTPTTSTIGGGSYATFATGHGGTIVSDGTNYRLTGLSTGD